MLVSSKYKHQLPKWQETEFALLLLYREYVFSRLVRQSFSDNRFFFSSCSLYSPFGFAGQDKGTLGYMREAELKHSRLAMLAVVGWPLAELLDKPIAQTFGLAPALTKSGASPSVLNGGLANIDAAYWVAVVALAGIVGTCDRRDARASLLVFDGCL